MTERIWRTLVLVLVIAVVAVACSTSETVDTPTTTAGDTATTTAGDTATTTAAPAEPIKVTIAHLADLTGPAKAPNEAQIRGIELALAKLATEGEVEITLDRRDTSCDAARATAIMAEVVADDSIVFQFGPACSGEFFAAIPIAEQNEIPIASFSSGGVFPGEFPAWAFRTSFAENAASKAIVRLLQEELGATRIATAFTGDNDFARTSAEFFITQAEAAGLDIVNNQTFSSQDLSYTTISEEIVASNPDAVYIATSSNTEGLLIKALRAAGLEVPVVGSNNTFHSPKDVWETAGGGLGDVFFVAPYDPADTRPIVQEFLAAFAAAFPDACLLYTSDAADDLT